MVEEGLATLLHDEGLIDARAMRVTGNNVIRAIQLKQDVFVVVDEPGYLGQTSPGDLFFNTAAKSIILVIHRLVWSDHPNQLIFSSVLIEGESASNFVCLTDLVGIGVVFRKTAKDSTAC